MKVYSALLTPTALRVATRPAYSVEIDHVARTGTITCRLFRWEPSTEGARRRNGEHYLDSGPRYNGYTGERLRREGPWAATYNEHGRWMARLFDVDPSARIAHYNGRTEFHAVTGGAYLTPAAESANGGAILGAVATYRRTGLDIMSPYRRERRLA